MSSETTAQWKYFNNSESLISPTPSTVKVSFSTSVHTEVTVVFVQSLQGGDVRRAFHDLVHPFYGTHHLVPLFLSEDWRTLVLRDLTLKTTKQITWTHTHKSQSPGRVLFLLHRSCLCCGDNLSVTDSWCLHWPWHRSHPGYHNVRMSPESETLQLTASSSQQSYIYRAQMTPDKSWMDWRKKYKKRNPAEEEAPQLLR